MSQGGNGDRLRRMPEQPEASSDPFHGRMPTAHERLAGRPWDASYYEGCPPWDIGAPQPAIVRLATRIHFAGPVLDIGCGTGENALYVAALGIPVSGVDVAETAIAIAREKANARGLSVRFDVADALDLAALGRTFRTALDCGLFHAFDALERARYAASLAFAMDAGAHLYVLCFSDDGPDQGPHPVSQDDVRAAFDSRAGWRVVAITPERVHTRIHDDNGAPAWLATIERISRG